MPNTPLLLFLFSSWVLVRSLFHLVPLKMSKYTMNWVRRSFRLYLLICCLSDMVAMIIDICYSYRIIKLDCLSCKRTQSFENIFTICFYYGITNMFYFYFDFRFILPPTPSGDGLIRPLREFLVFLACSFNWISPVCSFCASP